ncbi:MAG: hypothetical protein JNJ85_17335 [Candidatus Kapabacteria bacterium]|nr:hypothetical protein [Candidatus Kapabacteria bacterium]
MKFITVFIAITVVTYTMLGVLRTPQPTTAHNLKTPMHSGKVVPKLGKELDCIFQDRNNNYWFASNSEGVFRYDGKEIVQFTEQDGLCCNFVFTIQEDIHGTLWFSTRDGVCSYNGLMFTNQTKTIKNAPMGSVQFKRGGLFFNNLNSICYYDGNTFTNFVIHPDSYKPETYTLYRPYGMYSSMIDTDGKAWFGMQEKGICIYDGKTRTYINEKGLTGPAVRAVFQDKAGVWWFGNNGAGLFRYDGTTLTNITDEKGLGNPEFLAKGKFADKLGTMARVFAINEDKNGNLWIGTIDAGVWKYDGTTLTNYTTKDGLGANSIRAIYKDKKGELWFVDGSDTVYTCNGMSFTKVTF